MAVRPKWDLDDPGEEALEGGSFYDGDVPPIGTYRCKVMGARVKKDKNDDDRVNFWIEIQDVGAKKRYSGYRFYDGQSIAKREVQQRIWKQIVHALGVSWSDFLRKTVLDGKTNSDDPVDVIKFGGVPVEKLPYVVIAARRTTYQGSERLEAARWMPFVPKDDDPDEDDFDEDDEDEFGEDDEDGEEPPF